MSKNQILIEFDGLPHHADDEDEIALAIQSLLSATLGVPVSVRAMSEDQILEHFATTERDHADTDVFTESVARDLGKAG